MSNNAEAEIALGFRTLFSRNCGGADRDRTDDLKLAKLALSQLSYGPDLSNSTMPSAEGAIGGPGKI
jgi:hypothetical protein